MRGSTDDHLAVIAELLGKTSFKATVQPFNPRIDEVGSTKITIRREEHDGGHLIGVLEITEFEVQTRYAFKTYAPLCTAIVARLRERFG